MTTNLPSFTSIYSLFFLLCFTAFFSSANFTNPLFLQPPSAGNHHQHRRDHHQHCNRFAEPKYPPSLCFQFPTLTQQQPQQLHHPSPPPPPDDDDVDPRYGVQKRLIPSGPNPLHN